LGSLIWDKSTDVMRLVKEDGYEEKFEDSDCASFALLGGFACMFRSQKFTTGQ
jgi:hypothetical protein